MHSSLHSEWHRPFCCHGRIHRAIHLEASSHTCTQSHVMRTYRDTWARIHHWGIRTRTLASVRRSRTGKFHLWSCTRTRPHTPRHPFLPIPDPVPSLPLPSHLPGPIPSIKLLKQVSQQAGRGKVSVCPSARPHPAWPGSAHQHPHPQHQCEAWDAYTSTAQDCTEMGHMKETRASRQPYTRAPGAPGHPPRPHPLGSLRGCQEWFGTGLCGLKVTLPYPIPGPNFRGSRKGG